MKPRQSINMPSETDGDLLSCLRIKGMRRTPALLNLLREMMAHPHPASLHEWSQRPGLQQHDPVTIYRIMMKLERAGVVRRVNISERSACFQLVLPGPQPGYLVCTCCGNLKMVEPLPELQVMEQQFTRHEGWRGVRHELEFFGLCPQCAESGNKSTE